MTAFMLSVLSAIMFVQGIRVFVRQIDEDEIPMKEIWREIIWMLWENYEKAYYDLFNNATDPDSHWFRDQLMQLTQEEWDEYASRAIKALRRE
jgi:translation initiation factor 2 alpha subunit (eIF-2alpha)